MHDGQPPLDRVGDLGIGPVAPGGQGGRRAGGEHLLDGVVRRAPPELHCADVGDLAQRHARHLGSQIDDALPQRRGQAARVARRFPPPGRQ